MSAADRLDAVYLIETPLDPAAAADVLAGEQSAGTFVRVAGETEALRARSRASVEAVEELEPLAAPSLPNAWLERKGARGPWRRARVTVSFPLANIGPNLASLAATVAGNLYDLGELTGVRLVSLALPAAYRAGFDLPRHGVAGTRALTGVQGRPILGTIVKPNVGLSAEATAALVADLCEAGVDFIKDDEVCADPAHAPLAARVPAVMARIRAYRERTGRNVMYAFNITDETDAMRRHADLVEREGGCCAMASLNWCGFSALQTLRRSTGLAIHGHRNGFGAFSRHPALGMDFDAYQTLWRLTGIDHLHVHGMNGKFAQANEEVVASARACLTPLGPPGPAGADAVMPVLSSGQWAGTMPVTFASLSSDDLIFLAGGGILAHPDGPAAGVRSLQQGWQAVRSGVALVEHARGAPELRRALEFFGPRA
jgi:ribulose-bisphosphate carboxylase large chain